MIEGADQRVEEAERNVRRLTGKYAVPLARAKHDEGVDAIQRARGLTGELRQALAAVRAPEAQLLGIATAAAGSVDGRAVWTDARVAEVERALDAVEHMLPARVPS